MGACLSFIDAVDETARNRTSGLKNSLRVAIVSGRELASAALNVKFAAVGCKFDEEASEIKSALQKLSRACDRHSTLWENWCNQVKPVSFIVLQHLVDSREKEINTELRKKIEKCVKRMNQHEISHGEYKRAIKEKFVQNGLQSVKEVCTLAFEKYETYQKQIYEIAYAKKTQKKVPDVELERSELLAQYRLDEALKALKEARDDVEKILCEAFKTAQSLLAKYIKTLSNPNLKLDSINTHVGDAYEDLKDKVFADLQMRQMNVKMVAGAIKKAARKERVVLNEGNVGDDEFMKKKGGDEGCMHASDDNFILITKSCTKYIPFCWSGYEPICKVFER